MARKLKFPNACVRIGKADFDEVFEDELRSQEGNLSLDRYCEDGGFPDLETLELEIGETTLDGDTVAVCVKCTFDEVTTTGCADIRYGYGRVGRLVVYLTSDDEDGEIDYGNDPVLDNDYKL